MRHQRGAHLLRFDPANVAEVRLAEELLAEADLGDGVARELLGELAYRSDAPEEALAERGVPLVTKRAGQRGRRQRIKVYLSALKRSFGLGADQDAGEARHANHGQGPRAYTCAFRVNRLLGLP